MPRYRDHYELYLALLWGSVLETQRIPIRDSFFRLGGDPESARSMLFEIEREFGTRMPEDQFAAAPTIEALAVHIWNARLASGAKQKPFRVPSSTSTTSDVPLVLLHSVEGEFIYYERILCSDLGLPVVAVRSVGVDLEDEPLTTVDAMADRYIAGLDHVGVREPYVLVGMSASAVVALEMALRWEERGNRVAYLGLFEPPPMRAIPYDLGQLMEMRLRELCTVAGVEFTPDRMQDCVDALRRSGEIPETYPFELVMRRAKIFALNVLSAYGYSPPSRFKGHTVLYESRDFGGGREPLGSLLDPEVDANDFERYWARYIPAGTLIRRQDCEHRSLGQTLETRKFLREDIGQALRALDQP